MSLTESQVIDLIKNIFRPILAPGAKNLLDDGAELPPCPPGHTRVMSLDAFQEHNDFKMGLEPLESAGHRAIIQNLSDLAAMGAKPVGFLWSLEIPPLWLENQALYLKRFCEGAFKTAQENNLEFYGGDLSAAQNFSCAITVLGDVLGKPLGRQGAQPGDKIYVSRKLGVSAGAELKLGQQLVGVARACMDISDGLAKDLARLCAASGVGAHLHTVPNHPQATREQALYGGEDYALLFTAPQSQVGIEIGTITKAPQILLKNKILKPGGYDHFSSFSANQTPR